MGQRFELSAFVLCAVFLLAHCGEETVSGLAQIETPSIDDDGNHNQYSDSIPQLIPFTIIEPEEVPPPVVWLAPRDEVLDCGNHELEFTFDPNNHEYSLSNAFWMMWFAKRSFSGEREATHEELTNLGYDRYQFIVNETSGLEVLIVASDDALIVAFQGSKQLIDWFSNFMFVQTDASAYGLDGKVHQGFTVMLDSEWDAILQTVEDFHTNNQPVWVTGHSLGAALGTLTAARLASSGYPMAPLYTHASPRVGNREFAEDFYQLINQRHYRYVNEEDIVPRLAPAGTSAEAAAGLLPFGLGELTSAVFSELDYAHAGDMFRIEPNGDLTYFPAMQEDEDAAYWSNVNFGTILDMIVNPTQELRHKEDTYLCKMREVWERNP